MGNRAYFSELRFLLVWSWSNPNSALFKLIEGIDRDQII